MEHETITAEICTYSIILEPQESGGYTARFPALPEAVTEGDTELEALSNAGEAIRLALAYRRDNGIALPPETVPEVRRITIVV